MTERPMTRDQYRAAWRMARLMTWQAFVKHAPRRFGEALTIAEAHRIYGARRWIELCRDYPRLCGDSTLLARTSRPYAAKRMREARAG